MNTRQESSDVYSSRASLGDALITGAEVIVVHHMWLFLWGPGCRMHSARLDRRKKAHISSSNPCPESTVSSASHARGKRHDKDRRRSTSSVPPGSQCHDHESSAADPGGSRGGCTTGRLSRGFHPWLSSMDMASTSRRRLGIERGAACTPIGQCCHAWK